MRLWPRFPAQFARASLKVQTDGPITYGTQAFPAQFARASLKVAVDGQEQAVELFFPRNLRGPH